MSPVLKYIAPRTLRYIGEIQINLFPLACGGCWRGCFCSRESDSCCSCCGCCDSYINYAGCVARVCLCGCCCNLDRSLPQGPEWDKLVVAGEHWRLLRDAQELLLTQDRRCCGLFPTNEINYEPLLTAYWLPEANATLATYGLAATVSAKYYQVHRKKGSPYLVYITCLQFYSIDVGNADAVASAVSGAEKLRFLEPREVALLR